MMIDQNFFASLLRASLISIIPFGVWLWGRFGSKKSWYFQTSATSIVFGLARFWYYVFPFLAVAFLFFGVADYFLLQKNSGVSSVWFYVGMASGAIGFICGFLQPAWLSPTWLQRLKREHGDVIQLLIEDAVGMNKHELERRLATWEDIEGWVTEVRHNRGL